MSNLREWTSDEPTFQVEVRKEEGKIRSININHGLVLHDLGREAIYAF